MTITTGTNSVTDYHYIAPAQWKGETLYVQNTCPCFGGEHELVVMHHYGDNPDGGPLLHYCPTGFLMCRWCGGWADEPEPHACTKWGQP